MSLVLPAERRERIEMKVRGLRRANLDRMKARARRVYPDDPKAIKLANHLAHCSCLGCTNRRHQARDGRTMQEKRAGLD